MLCLRINYDHFVKSSTCTILFRPYLPVRLFFLSLKFYLLNVKFGFIRIGYMRILYFLLSFISFFSLLFLTFIFNTLSSHRSRARPYLRAAVSKERITGSKDLVYKYNPSKVTICRCYSPQTMMRSLPSFPFPASSANPPLIRFHP